MIPSSIQLSAAFHDIADGFGKWRLWGFMGWQEIRQRYRRSTLGPLWVTLSTGITIGAMGFIWGHLFGLRSADYLPFITMGWVAWGLFSSIVNEGANSFINSQSFITQMRQPLFIYAILPIWRNIILFFHNIIIYVVVAIIFSVKPTLYTLLIFITLPLAILSLSWVSLLLGALSARFRDVPIIVQNLMTVVFFLTPVIWPQEQLGSLAKYVYLNPLAGILELIRQPLMGSPPSEMAWLVTIGFTIVGWTIAVLFFAKTRSRIPYWL